MTPSPTPPATPEMVAELAARMNFCLEGETIQIRMEDARALLATAVEAERQAEMIAMLTGQAKNAEIEIERLRAKNAHAEKVITGLNKQLTEEIAATRAFAERALAARPASAAGEAVMLQYRGRQGDGWTEWAECSSVWADHLRETRPTALFEIRRLGVIGPYRASPPSPALDGADDADGDGDGR